MKSWEEASLEELTFGETQRVKSRCTGLQYNHIHICTCEMYTNPESGICTCGKDINLDS